DRVVITAHHAGAFLTGLATALAFGPHRRSMTASLSLSRKRVPSIKGASASLWRSVSRNRSRVAVSRLRKSADSRPLRRSPVGGSFWPGTPCDCQQRMSQIAQLEALMRTIGLSLILWCAFVSTAFAWGQEEHSISAEIAQRRLSTEAAAA